MKALVFIILDAFRWDYISKEHTPILHSMARKGVYVEKLISVAGFAERAPIFTGAHLDTSGYFTAYSYDPEKSPFKFIKPFSRLLAILSKNDFVNRATHFALAEFGRFLQKHGVVDTYLNPALIPFEVLPYIGVTEDEKTIFKKSALSVESVFDVLHDEEIGFEFLIHPVADILGNDDAILNEALKRASRRKCSLYFMQFISSDHECHIYGSESDIRIKVTREIDRKIGVLKEHFEKIYRDAIFFIIGDHGMMDVTKRIDVFGNVIKFAKKNNLKFGKDFIMFLDSTLARFWFFNSEAEIIEDYFLKNFSEYGYPITKDIAKKYRIPYKNKKYGDFVFWMKPGILINPDYFWSHTKPPRAMHGYDPHHEKMKGFAVVYSKDIEHKKIEEAHLVDVCPTLCDLIGIRYPKNNEGVSFLKM